MQKLFNQLVENHGWWHNKQPIMVAVSTGVDSMILLDLLLNLTSNQPLITVAYVNHGLRTQSVQETDFIKQYCQTHHLELVTTEWKLADHPQEGIEAAAREFRYAFFQTEMQKRNINVLLTAHHGDDLAETMLMKLSRGGQLSSLVGITFSRDFKGGRLIRPLLPFSKDTIKGYAHNHSLTWFEDETNQELTVTRNRIRHLVIPQLKSENNQFLKHVYEYSTQLQELLLVQQELMTPLIEGMTEVVPDGIKVDLVKLRLHSRQLQISLMRLILEKQLQIANVSYSQIEQIIKLVNNERKPQGMVNLSKLWLVQKQYTELLILKGFLNEQATNHESKEVMVLLNRWYQAGRFYRVGVFETQQPQSANQMQICLNLRANQLPLSLRKWLPGDKIRLTNGGHQKVSRLFINNKVPTEFRNETHVLLDNCSAVISVIGLKTISTVDNEAVRKYYFCIQQTDEKRD